MNKRKTDTSNNLGNELIRVEINLLIACIMFILFSGLKNLRFLRDLRLTVELMGKIVVVISTILQMLKSLMLPGQNNGEV